MNDTEAIYVVDKSEWGEGPWMNEPDKVQFRTEAGLPGLIVRSNPHIGVWCGYAAVDRSHPLYGKGYDEVDVDVHGGLTYSNRCMEDGHVCHVPEPGEPDDVWWFGFDCGHYRDLAPATLAIERKIFAEDHPLHVSREKYGYVYRDQEYVMAEVEQLARQLVEMK